MSIADAIRPPDPRYEVESPDPLRVATSRRGGRNDVSWDDDMFTFWGFIDDNEPTNQNTQEASLR
jgi:hypothetical protein